jgi:hypothetical protein
MLPRSTNDDISLSIYDNLKVSRITINKLINKKNNYIIRIPVDQITEHIRTSNDTIIHIEKFEQTYVKDIKDCITSSFKLSKNNAPPFQIPLNKCTLVLKTNNGDNYNCNLNKAYIKNNMLCLNVDNKKNKNYTISNYLENIKNYNIKEIDSILTLSAISRNISALPARRLNGVAVWCFNQLSSEQQLGWLFGGMSWFWIIASDQALDERFPGTAVQRDNGRPWARVYAGC